MSSLVSSTVSAEFVEQFLEREKDDARLWLRSEMDSLVDSLFGQLRTKFVACLVARESGGQELLPECGLENEHLSEQVLFDEIDDEISNQIQNTNSANSTDSTLSEHLNQNLVKVKEEIIEDVVELDTNNEQPLSDMSNETTFGYKSENEAQEEDCDCYECQSLVVKNEQEEYDDDFENSVDFIQNLEVEDTNQDEGSDYNQEGHQFIPKRSRFDDRAEESSSTSRPHQRMQSSSDGPQSETGPQQVDSIDNYRFTTVSLKCLDNCGLMFPTEMELEQHLIQCHQMSLSQCSLPFCNQSFVNLHELSQHVRLIHSNLSQWPCHLCGRMFTKHSQLYQHNHFEHRKGCFKCAQSDCSFIGATRHEMYRHFNVTHCQLFTCPYANCGRRFKQRCTMTRHTKIHLGLKPYLCRWPGCSYASERNCTIVQHIRTQHFKLPATLKRQAELNIVDVRDPKQYLEVRHDLLTFLNGKY